jgi:hypothetical protein
MPEMGRLLEIPLRISVRATRIPFCSAFPHGQDPKATSH